MAYSPRTKYLYQQARYFPPVFQTWPTNITGGTTPGWGSTTDDVPGITNYGKYGAIDIATEKIASQITVPQPAA